MTAPNSGFRFDAMLKTERRKVLVEIGSEFGLGCKSSCSDVLSLKPTPEGGLEVERCLDWDFTGKKPRETVKVELARGQTFRLGDVVDALHDLAKQLGGFSRAFLERVTWAQDAEGKARPETIRLASSSREAHVLQLVRLVQLRLPGKRRRSPEQRSEQRPEQGPEQGPEQRPEQDPAKRQRQLSPPARDASLHRELDRQLQGTVQSELWPEIPRPHTSEEVEEPQVLHLRVKQVEAPAPSAKPPSPNPVPPSAIPPRPALGSPRNLRVLHSVGLHSALHSALDSLRAEQAAKGAEPPGPNAQPPSPPRPPSPTAEVAVPEQPEQGPEPQVLHLRVQRVEAPAPSAKPPIPNPVPPSARLPPIAKPPNPVPPSASGTLRPGAILPRPALGSPQNSQVLHSALESLRAEQAARGVPFPRLDPHPLGHSGPRPDAAMYRLFRTEAEDTMSEAERMLRAAAEHIAASLRALSSARAEFMTDPGTMTEVIRLILTAVENTRALSKSTPDCVLELLVCLKCCVRMDVHRPPPA